MQGGRNDSSVLGWWGRFGGDHGAAAESSGYESEVEVTSRISLGILIDDLIHLLRTTFAVAISLPIAWLTLHPSIGSFRERKFRLVESGTKTVVDLQQASRHWLLDYYFQAFSFCAEEEFYLLVLPYTIWNIDRVLGRRYVLLACIGLMIGNIMKDVFALPRPSSPPVWRPSHQESIDSTQLQDFGFPSTHAMNAVSNSVFTLLYFTTSPSSIKFDDVVNPETYKWIVVCLWYMTSLCFSRLYLGAHSPTDIRGGLALGVIWVSVYFSCSEIVDHFYLTTTNLFLKVLGITIVALLLNPQPRPPTPTFIQNALICGLLSGVAFGCRNYLDLGNVAVEGSTVIIGEHRFNDWNNLVAVNQFISTYAKSFPYATIFVRTILGYAIVLVLRVLAKTVSTSILSLVGISLKPKIEEPRKEDDDDGDEDTDDDSQEKKRKRRRRHRRRRVVRLFTRDIDIVGNAFVKVTTYNILAWAITFFVPVVCCLLGLSNYVKEDVVK